ncbi:hypothetical protein KKI23_02835, partial [Patescibacteria group bacterium]|nr:hypothetical protein [Patescibacteria group bacterium]
LKLLNLPSAPFSAILTLHQTNMKKLLIIILVLVTLAVAAFFWYSYNKKGNLIGANAAIICFQEENRYTPAQMIEDGLSNEQVQINLDKVSAQKDLIAQEFGFATEDAIVQYWAQLPVSLWSELSKKSYDQVRQTCNPDYKSALEE